MLERHQGSSIVHPMEGTSELKLSFPFLAIKPWGVLVSAWLNVALEYSSFLEKVPRVRSDF